MLLEAGWCNERIASALRVTLPTLRKHYFSELKHRDVARDRRHLDVSGQTEGSSYPATNWTTIGSGEKENTSGQNRAEFWKDRDAVASRLHDLEGHSESAQPIMPRRAPDPIIEAVMRGTWDATVLSKTQADFTSLTTAVDGINFTSGNPIAMGFRVGDVFRANGLPDAANKVATCAFALSAAKIMTAEQLTANAVADTSCTLTRPGKRLINPATLLKSYFAIEKYGGQHRSIDRGAGFRVGRYQVLDVLGGRPLDR